ncbi:UDP-4-amino-4,6-dideoxy-N-acetyl-beta-L-altrosamine transaminase [Tardiphaga alba]|uniref:UDP-4-amino-4, 6-dideoxy-N-acetyl-beta-L-altrosamine transaminase n=1 Tax=Tardiphaga alba TaxID=340268 RepID=A0ABX8AF00_9BRAD|nr:UDP-4-amino-4,6-dideoxy-N-acetyl-beta-L-altrosamine transaminase [Tardiphaga alba]QUS42346.1 UDP-4-amino-4,6-dideoxy-N-acetyl-beta-L-altrosamine transaminase [Tardiphaga alba]
MQQKFLPYGRQLIEDDDIEAVAAVLRGDYLTTGPTVAAFETALAARLDAPFAVACSSATAGLHLAAMALGLDQGDVAIVPANTFLATANAIRYVGADVVFSDVDPDTGLSTATHFEAATKKASGPVKVILPVHFAGQAQGPEEIRKVAERQGAKIIEDACHAIGAEYDRNGVRSKIGACLDSDMAVFSFHPVKTIAMGEGGAVTTRDAGLAEKLSRFRSHGMVRDATRFSQQDMATDTSGGLNTWYYEMSELGFNYRASDIHCALGLSQLRKLDRFVAHRNDLADHYDHLLAPIASVVRPLRRIAGSSPAWHLYVALFDFQAIGKSRAQVMAELQMLGVGTQVHYVPVPHQPYYRALYGNGEYPGAEAYYSRCLSLPMFASMSHDDATHVVDSIVRVLNS